MTKKKWPNVVTKKNWRLIEVKNKFNFVDKLKRPQEELLMDLGDGARKRNEVLNQIDRNLAFIDDGKGYRVGSEFWNQPQCVGSEETGIQ